MKQFEKTLILIYRRLPKWPVNFSAYRAEQTTFPACFESCIAVFCDPREWLKTNPLYLVVEKEPDVRAIFGCHPHFADHMDAAAFDMLNNLLERPNAVGLGEIGLDYSHKNNVDHDIQKMVFRAQLALAKKRIEPICLHVREADEDAFQVLEEVLN